MPTYSYRCTECDNAFDVQQSFTDDALTVCDRCGGALRKVFGAVGIAFKGSGFYRNDHGAAKKSESTSTATSSDAGASDAGSSAAPAKPSTPSASPATSTSTPSPSTTTA